MAITGGWRYTIEDPGEPCVMMSSTRTITGPGTSRLCVDTSKKNRRIINLLGEHSLSALCTYFVSNYICTGSTVKGTLHKRVNLSGTSPMEIYVNYR